jgi:integrase
MGEDDHPMEDLHTTTEWGEAIHAWRLTLLAANRSNGTIYQRTYHLRRLAVWSRRSPWILTLDDLTEYLAAQSVGANTQRARRTSIAVFYTWAHATGRMATNPSLLLPHVHAPLGVPRPAPLEAIEQGRQALDPRVPLMVLIGAKAGLRRAEISRVHVDDLRRDLLGWSLHVVGKGRRERVVPVSELAALVRINADPSGWLFPGKIDGHLSPGRVGELISEALPDGVTAHKLRHLFASRAYNLGGKDIRAVQELLGHSSVATTQIYTAVEDEAKRRAALAA